MHRLSERWFKFADKITTAIFSFIFFWVALAYLADADNKITHYLNHLSNQTGNDGYSAIETLIVVVSIIIGYVLIMMPFGVIIMLIFGDRIGDKKSFILRFPLIFLKKLIVAFFLKRR